MNVEVAPDGTFRRPSLSIWRTALYRYVAPRTGQTLKLKELLLRIHQQNRRLVPDFVEQLHPKFEACVRLE